MFRYYIIHGVDREREPRLRKELTDTGVDPNGTEVYWVRHPNKDELSEEFIRGIIPSNDFLTHNFLYKPSDLRPGMISCSYKHYLGLKDFVENHPDCPYAVIMEDTVGFQPGTRIQETLTKYIQQLDELYPGEWDILFDCDWCDVYEHPIQNDVLVYPKSNHLEYRDGRMHGGTRVARFYLVTQSCAKKLVDHWLPLRFSPDWWMNDLFRMLNIRSFWSQPPVVFTYPHESTA